MKKLCLFLLVTLMIFSAFGCSKEEKSGEISNKGSQETSDSKENEEGITNDLFKQSEYDTISEYTRFLKEAKGNEKNIEFYLDEYTEEEHVVTVENPTDLFYFCDFTLDSTDKDSDFLVLARPHRNEYYYRHFDDVPETYVINDGKFYEFTYPNAGFDYTIEDDGDSEGYVWENVIVAPENNNLEALTPFAKRMYAECVLTDLWYEFYYVFDDTVEKVEYDGYYYYDLETANYGFKVDLEEKKITFYEPKEESWEECLSIEMD